jgi:hypothetical protein
VAGGGRFHQRPDCGQPIREDVPRATPAPARQVNVTVSGSWVSLTGERLSGGENERVDLDG